MSLLLALLVGVPEASFPDSIARPAPLAAQFVALPSAPEGALPLDWGPDRYPDTITCGSVLATTSQQFTTELPPKPEGALADDWQPSYPDRAIRLSLAPAAIPFETFAPAPERTTPLASTTYPDRIERLVPELRQPWATSPAPERTRPLATAIFPDTIVRLVPELRQAWTTSPAPERTLPIASATFPDAIVRLLPQEQQYSALWPFPLPGVVTGWWPSFPDFARSLVQPVYEQPTTARPIAPERTSPLASASFPDSVYRPTPQEQQATALWPLPLPGAPTGWWPSFPHRIERLVPDLRQATALWPVPIVPLSSGWAPDYPDIVRGLSLGVQEQQSTTRNVAPERTTPLASASFPDRVERLVPDLRQALGLSIVPPAPFTWGWTPTYPDRVLSLTAPPWLPWVPIQPPFPNLLLGPPRFTLADAPILNFTALDAPLLDFALSDANLQNFTETTYP